MDEIRRVESLQLGFGTIKVRGVHGSGRVGFVPNLDPTRII